MTTDDLTAATLHDLLYYGYDPNCCRSGLPDVLVESIRETPPAEEYDTLVSMAQEAFRASVGAALEDADGDGTHLVPLSSGLDSRAILATLLDRPDVAPSDVRTVTFGTPGTWDFELGTRVASAAGVRNKTVDLRPRSFDWSVESLRAYARERDHPTRVLEGYVNATVTSLADGATVWSGFLGGPTTGKEVHASPRGDWDDAVASFVESNHYSTLSPSDYDPKASLPEEPYLPREAVPYRNQLSFAHRQQCYIGPVVLGDGPRCTPFARPEWLEFVMNVPRRHRAERRLMVDAMSDAFPDLFSIPTDANAGYPLSVGERRRKLRRGRLLLTKRVTARLGIPYTHPDTNYVDFERAFRTAGELRDSAETLLAALAERGVVAPVDPRAVWRDHQTGADRSNDIAVLCSLELFLDTRDGA